MNRKCYFTGCKHAATWAATKLFGKRDTIHVCDQHKPDVNNRPERQRSLPFFYDVQPITDESCGAA